MTPTDDPEAQPASMRRTLPWPVLLAALGAATVAGIQLRDGVLQILDTVSYLSGAQAVRDGHPFTSTIAPSFSNFTVIEVLDRGGRLPFVDFPVGYSTLAGLLSFVMGARRALGFLVIVATAALAVGITLGPSRPSAPLTAWLRASFAVLVVGIPVYRLVVQGVLSEPLFCAVLVGYVASLVRYRHDGGGFLRTCVLGASLGLLRFLGGGLAVLVAVERYRRERRVRPALLTAAACLAPVALNVVVAGAVGGGHTNHWHGIDGRDLRLVGRSISGMLDATTGDLARTLLQVGDDLPWWGYIVTVAWVVAVIVAVLQYLGLVKVLPTPLEMCLVAAGLLTFSLFGGIAAFDALATPDNRIMLPAGLLTLCGIVWSVELTERRVAGIAGGILAVWAVTAVRPWDVGHLFSQPDRLADARQFSDLDAAVVITNEADLFAMATGIPAAYLPPERMALTDEPVDRDSIYAELPCALARNDGAVVLFTNAFFGGGDATERLDVLRADGRLEVLPFDTGTIYLPTEASCD